MSDASLDKLFDEMRAVTATDAHLAKKREQQANIGKLIEARLEKSRRRKRILDETLRLYIHEGMTILAAKMAAPENVDAEDKKRVAGSVIWAQHLSTNTLSANHIRAGADLATTVQAFGKPTRWQRVLKWLYVKLGGAS
jgi:hypothetical protein